MYKYLILIIVMIVSSCDDSINKVASKEKRLSTKLINNNQSIKQKKISNKQPVFEINKDLHDFGDIIEGEKVTHKFIITNSGMADLIISSAKGSCGCTVPQWPKDPIRPGKKAEIKVTFNSKGRLGSQTKKVSVISNAIPNAKILTIRGNVIAK
jgi:hypothetical protein